MCFVVLCCCAVVPTDRWPISLHSAYRSTMREGLTNFGEASGQNWLADGLVSQAWQVWLKLFELLHCMQSAAAQTLDFKQQQYIPGCMMAAYKALTVEPPESQQRLLPYW